MLKLNMTFDTVILKKEGKFFTETEKGWMSGVNNDPSNMNPCTKEQVLEEIRKPFKIVQYNPEDKSICIYIQKSKRR